ncbi:MAG TPA: LuxR C-terminal-related transcriptional regulator [Methylomirabilota bacterium]|nr:LuxR C-terminal-related transcriptional regulator [Methylomirabilota bacterium]
MIPRHEMGLDEALGRAGDGVCAIGSEGRIVLWNRSAEKIMGHTTREVVGKPCCDVFVGKDEHGNRLCYQGCHVQSLVRMGEPIQNFDMETRTKSGQPIWLNVSILVVSPNHGRGPMTIHFFRDITATKDLLALVQERTSAPAGPSSANGDAGLTRRELEILRLIATGVNTKIAAERLHVSPATVRNHVQNILGKLGAHSRLEAVAYANNHRLL